MTPSHAEDPAPENTVQLHDHAMDNISYIREAMARSSHFTGVPGWGMVIVGGLALLGSYVANLRLHLYWWANTWVAIGGVSILIAVVAIWLKAHRSKTVVLTTPGKRFFLCFSPPILAGMALTEIFYVYNLVPYMPTMWLLLYGVAVLNAGVFSIPIVPIWGLCVFTLGFLAIIFAPSQQVVVLNYTATDLCMVAGFSLSHIVFGLIIALRHGG